MFFQLKILAIPKLRQTGKPRIFGIQSAKYLGIYKMYNMISKISNPCPHLFVYCSCLKTLYVERSKHNHTHEWKCNRIYLLSRKEVKNEKTHKQDNKNELFLMKSIVFYSTQNPSLFRLPCFSGRSLEFISFSFYLQIVTASARNSKLRGDFITHPNEWLKSLSPSLPISFL